MRVFQPSFTGLCRTVKTETLGPCCQKEGSLNTSWEIFKSIGEEMQALGNGTLKNAIISIIALIESVKNNGDELKTKFCFVSTSRIALLQIHCKIVKLVGSILPVKAREEQSACCLSSFFQKPMMSFSVCPLPKLRKWRKHSKTTGSAMLIFCHWSRRLRREWLEMEEYVGTT